MCALFNGIIGVTQRREGGGQGELRIKLVLKSPINIYHFRSMGHSMGLVRIALMGQHISSVNGQLSRWNNSGNCWKGSHSILTLVTKWVSAGWYPGQGVSIVAKDDWRAVTGGNIFNWFSVSGVSSVSGNVRMGLQCRDGRRTLYWAIRSLSDTSYLQFGLHKKRKKYIGDVNNTLITLNWRKFKFFIATMVHIRRQLYL